MSSRRRARAVLTVFVASALVLGCTGCAGSSGGAADETTTSFPYLIDPLEPGAGFIQLGPNRYPFDGVICATGPVASDPEGSTRIFGVYANFEVDGSLAAVALTRYHNEIHGKTNSVPTLTETALIQMQGDKEIRGLSAKRFQVVGEKNWHDPNDPSATKPLISRSGGRYEAKGIFAPVNADVDTSTTSRGSGSTTPGAGDSLVGEVAARCPAKSTTVPAPGSSTTAPASPTTAPTSPTEPPGVATTEPNG